MALIAQYTPNRCRRQPHRVFCSDFVRRQAFSYGLHILSPQLVLVDPPSAWTAVGTTKVVRKSTAVPRTNSARFTLFSPCDCELDRDIFMLAIGGAIGPLNL